MSSTVAAVPVCTFVFLWGLIVYIYGSVFCCLGTGPIGLPCHGIRLDVGLSD